MQQGDAKSPSGLAESACLTVCKMVTDREEVLSSPVNRHSKVYRLPAALPLLSRNISRACEKPSGMPLTWKISALVRGSWHWGSQEGKKGSFVQSRSWGYHLILTLPFWGKVPQAPTSETLLGKREATTESWGRLGGWPQRPSKGQACGAVDQLTSLWSLPSL